MLVKYVTREYYSIDNDFNMAEIIESLDKEYPSDRFVLESAVRSKYGDEMIVTISQTLPAGAYPESMSFDLDDGEAYE